MLAGIAGAILGGAAETWINRTSGTVAVRDGLMWGAVVGVFFASLPNFTRMGYLTVKSDRSAINFVVGVGMFIVISLVGSAVFLGIFWLITRLLS